MTGSRRRLLWSTGVLVVLALMMIAIAGVRHAVIVQRTDDPRSTTGTGTRALAQLLTDHGVRLEATDDVADAVRRSDHDTLLVVAWAERLSGEQAAELGRARYGRILLYRPSRAGLLNFGVPAEVGPAPTSPVVPGCTERAAALAGAVDPADFRGTYRSSGGAVSLSCYPGSAGAGWLRVGGPFGPVDLVAGGVSNDVLAREGNAAFGLNVFGSHPRIVWLVGQQAADTTDRNHEPGLLPMWWAPAVVQAFIAVVVIGVWRGRRLGPILREPLPVTVRAAETVEGHGRLYARIGARDRAADALRTGVRDRLGRAYGQHLTAEPTEDQVQALSAAVAGRTGRSAPEVHRLIAGPPPATDDELVDLARHLDRLEQEARQP